MGVAGAAVRRRWALGGLIVVTAATGLGWLGLPVVWGTWATLLTLLAAISAAAGGVARGLRLARLPWAWAANLALIAAAAWLTWPIWATTAPTWATTIHPLLAADATADLGRWLQQPGVYGKTKLGSDVPYALPTSAWPAVAAHLALALPLAVPPRWLEIKGRQKPA